MEHILRAGKIGENVLNRSVRRVLEHSSDLWDSAVFSAEGHKEVMLSTDPITMTASSAGTLAVYAVANDLAAAGAVPAGILISILLPEGASEEQLRNFLSQIAEASERCGMRNLGGHTEVTGAVTRPVITAAGIGYASAWYDESRKSRSFCEHDGIIMTGYAGMEGTFLLAEEREKELLERFPAAMVYRTQKLKDHLSVLPAAEIGRQEKVFLMHDVSEGGIYSALWRLSIMTGKGMEISLPDIPVLQETVEYTNYYDIDPYRMESAGSLLMVCRDPERVCGRLAAAGIPAVQIGMLKDGNDKVVRNGEEIRFLDLPQPDTLLKILG